MAWLATLMAGVVSEEVVVNRKNILKLRAAGLVLPLLAFICLSFIAPLATMLVRSVYDPVVAAVLPETLVLLRQWDGEGMPGEAVYEAAARELVEARAERTLGQVVSRVNRVQGGLRSNRDI